MFSTGLGGLTCSNIISCLNNICQNNGICSMNYATGYGSCQCQPGLNNFIRQFFKIKILIVFFKFKLHWTIL